MSFFPTNPALPVSNTNSKQNEGGLRRLFARHTLGEGHLSRDTTDRPSRRTPETLRSYRQGLAGVCAHTSCHRLALCRHLDSGCLTNLYNERILTTTVYSIPERTILPTVRSRIHIPRRDYGYPSEPGARAATFNKPDTASKPGKRHTQTKI